MPPPPPADPGCGGDTKDEEVLLAVGEWKISTVKVPPVDGWRATSPREVENVERSSWAYCVRGVWFD